MGESTAINDWAEERYLDALHAELEVLRAVTNDLESAVRMGGLAGDPVALAFVWAQNKDAILCGNTTWEAQWGPHRRLGGSGRSDD